MPLEDVTKKAPGEKETKRLRPVAPAPPPKNTRWASELSTWGRQKLKGVAVLFRTPVSKPVGVRTRNIRRKKRSGGGLNGKAINLPQKRLGKKGTRRIPVQKKKKNIPKGVQSVEIAGIRRTKNNLLQEKKKNRRDAGYGKEKGNSEAWSKERID